MTQREFARAVDDPLQTVIDKHKAGLFKAAKSGGGRGHKVLYALEQVEEYKKLKLALRDPNAQVQYYNAEEAYAGFAALAAGKTVRDMVLELRMHPRRAEAIREDYERTGGGVALAKIHVDILLAMNLSGPTKIETGEDVIALVKAAAEEHACPCGRGPALRCGRCVAEKVGASRKREARPGQVGEIAGDSDPSDEEESPVARAG